jgi:hypothetical protein
MKYELMLEIIKKLPFDKIVPLNSDGEFEIYVLRPSTLGARFKEYDKEKNFQIWLREGTREFRPNHLRVMIDLNLRIRCRPDLKRQLLLAFDKIFYGESPDNAIVGLENEKFEHYLNSLKIIANLHQLFIVEQDYCYHKESKFEPATLFFQGWIRQMIDGPKEIDNLCMSICNGQPPQIKYTHLENKKHKHYSENRKALWYLE